MTIGLLPLARATFDVAFAETRLEAMLARLDATGRDFVGSRDLLFETAAARQALREISAAGADRILILQVTFTDDLVALEAAACGTPLAVWAIPEPRSGGRLRLNSLCGLNLASHALGRAGRAMGWMYSAPECVADHELHRLLDEEPSTPQAEPAEPPASSDAGRRLVGAIRGRRIARLGDHPDGFTTCSYSSREVREVTGVQVDAFPVENLFDRARSVPAETLSRLHARAETELAGLRDVDQLTLERSLRLKAALDTFVGSGVYDALAIRCWPECFTEYGGAVCGPVSMMGEDGVPCACEADVYGALSQMILQEAAGAPVFLTDLVDVDVDDGTAVLWHCGQAPVSICDPEVSARATVHSNRRMPLLYEFTLKPGRVTLMRLSQARNETRMVLCSGEMLARPAAYSGTSGVMRFDRAAGDVLADLIENGIEHHLAVVYGEHRPLLRQVAGAMGLSVLDL